MIMVVSSVMYSSINYNVFVSIKRTCKISSDINEFVTCVKGLTCALGGYNTTNAV